MIVIFEGMDRCGKDTQTAMLKTHFKNNVFHTMHYSNVNGLDSVECRIYSSKLYTEMFDIIKETSVKNQHLILNRAHLGEYVYGKIYRGYEGRYVFNIEEEFSDILNDIYLVVLVDDAKNIIERDDGNSHSTSLRDVNYEKQRFEEAFELSNIKNKRLIDINDKSISEVHETILRFIDE